MHTINYALPPFCLLQNITFSGFHSHFPFSFQLVGFFFCYHFFIIFFEWNRTSPKSNMLKALLTFVLFFLNSPNNFFPGNPPQNLLNLFFFFPPNIPIKPPPSSSSLPSTLLHFLKKRSSLQSK